jgi:phosphoribosyl-AMP cyclohydrolase
MARRNTVDAGRSGPRDRPGCGERQTGEAHYWSRSRGKLWHKGEESGHVQKVSSIRIDCDADVVLLGIEQAGGIACHTGRESCFYRELADGGWINKDAVLKDPREIYK